MFATDQLLTLNTETACILWFITTLLEQKLTNIDGMLGMCIMKVIVTRNK